MILPQTNATLVRVRAAGASEDYDQSAGTGAEKWTGRAGVYLRQRDERVTTGQSSSVVIARALIVPDLPVTWEEGDELELDDGQTVTVRGIEPFRHPTAVSEIRLLLEDA